MGLDRLVEWEQVSVMQITNYQEIDMSREQDIEHATKAAQCADLLLQDLQRLNLTGNQLVSMLVLPEIEKVAGVKTRLEALMCALKSA